MRRLHDVIQFRAMAAKTYCEALDRILREADSAFREAREIRRSKDLSFYEDSQLTRGEHKKIDNLVKHLLAGHDGKPCPAGDRPIVGEPKRAELLRKKATA
ncbi:MAG: hypothetical protein WCD43_14355 [Candidatus Acidiferrales bacterium]